MYKKPKSNARKVWAIVLIIWGGLGLLIVPAIFVSRGMHYDPTGLIGPGIMLLVGVLLLPKKPKGLGDFWKTDDPAQAQKVVKKVGRVKGDTDLMNIGRNAPLEEVARAAFRRVGSQKDISSFIRFSSDEARQRLALECLTDQRELGDLAVKCKKPVAAAALERLSDEKVIADVAASGSFVAAGAVDKLSDPNLLADLAGNPNAQEDARCRAYEKLGKPRMADAVRMTNLKQPAGLRDAAAERILNTDDPAVIVQAAEMACNSPLTPESRQFLMKAAMGWPDAMAPLGDRSWSNGTSNLIRVGCLEARGQLVEADRLRLERCDSFTEDEKRAAGLRLLENADDPTIRQVAGQVMKGRVTPAAQGFLINVAQSHPEIIRDLWPAMREWVHTDVKDHTDYTREAPHVDSTRYYDFFRYPDGRTVANRNGRKTHTDGPLPSSDCAEYGHTDTNRHTDTIDESFLGRFPKAARGE